MFGQLAEPNVLSQASSVTIMSVAKALFEYGTERLVAQEYEQSIRWLTNCFNISWNRGEEIFGEIRVKSIQNLGRALLSRNCSGDLAKVADLITTAVKEYSVAAWLYLLRFDYSIVRYSTSFKNSEDILASMIRVVHLDVSDVQQILSRAHSLSKHDYYASARVLDQLLMKAAARHESAWIEKTLVFRVWIALQNHEESDESVIDHLTKSFSDLESTLISGINCASVQAVQVVRQRCISSH